MEDHGHMNHHQAVSPGSTLTTYRPLILILTGILAVTLLTAWLRGNIAGPELMRLFMGYFFVVFASFKFLDLQGFADAYAEYDLVASRSRFYAFAYPFIEAVLGIAYLSAWQLTATNTITLIVMLVSSAGVLNALLGQQKIRCACLGAVIKLPMTTVTLIEDLGMAAMAVLMLLVS